MSCLILLSVKKLYVLQDESCSHSLSAAEKGKKHKDTRRKRKLA